MKQALPGMADVAQAIKPPALNYVDLARVFCDTAPYRSEPFRKRNWGGQLHSLCSYQGKLKPSIAAFLVSWFTSPGDLVLDPMSGVGTIPLEARRQGRVGIANDLSPLAYTISSAKLEPISSTVVQKEMNLLAKALAKSPTLNELSVDQDIDWGLNKTIRDYFHPQTMREVLAARHYFLRSRSSNFAEQNLIKSNLMHILHGNRPYALSRRSHPITPLAPRGPTEYRPLLERLQSRVTDVSVLLEELAESQPSGRATLGDFRAIKETDIDVIVTSPPFTKSLRFWSSNWMRLWFAGWDKDDFKFEPTKYLETEQRDSYEPYREFAASCANVLKPGGRLIMHLGETSSDNMAEKIVPLLEPTFNVVYVGRENVENTESHGLSDKGATIAHWYLFAQRA